MRSFLPLVALALLGGCGLSQADADLAAVRAVTMSGPAVSWSDLRVHTALGQRACAVSTLVNDSGTVVGYCNGGRQCRTMDWRPVLDGCTSGGVVAGRPQTTPANAPETAPVRPEGKPSVDLAQRR